MGTPSTPKGQVRAGARSWAGAVLGLWKADSQQPRHSAGATACSARAQGATTGSHERSQSSGLAPRSASEGAAGGLGKGPSPQPSHGCLRLALKENPQARRPCSRGHHTNSPGPSPAGHPASPAGRRAVSSRGPRGAAPRTCGPTAATQGSLSPSPSALRAPRTSHTLTSPPAAPFPEAGCPRPARLASPRERASVPGAVRGGRRPDPWAPTAAYLQGPG